jgi:hypothetical protein
MLGLISIQHRIFLFVFILFLVSFGLFPPLDAEQPRRNKIADENKRPGTTQWDSTELQKETGNRAPLELRARTRTGGDVSQAAVWTDTQVIKGYASRASINRGQPIDLHVSTSQPSFNIEIYRFGWYNGAGARLIMTIPSLPGRSYPTPDPDPITGMVECNWPVAYRLQTGTDWVTGVYQAKLIASNGSVGYIIFVVREDGAASDIMFPIAVTTYQAYNYWGGKSLYDHNSTGGRAAKVSFDRPYVFNAGAGPFYDGDYGMIRWLEREGYDVSYATSIDLHANPNLASNHKMILFNWHDEYWTKNMRDNAEAARDRGKHLAFFTANSAYWQIRLESSRRGVPYRVQVGYKDALIDPMANSPTPWLTTVKWRDAPVNRPENSLMGIMYSSNFGSYDSNYPFVVANASHWIYQGTGVQNGSSIPRVVGNEYDRVFNNGFTPPNLVILSRSPIPATGEVANASIYTASSGAMVFTASTLQWSWSLDDNPYERTPKNPIIERMTINLLRRMTGAAPTTPTATPTVVRTSTSSASTGTPGGIKLQYWAGDTSATDNQIKPHLNIVNQTNSAIPLSELKIRYYFTRDTVQPLAFTCHGAAVGCGNLTSTFVALSSPVGNADHYLEIGFSGGTLPANGQTGDIFVRINKADWSNFNESNDHSYDGTKKNFTDWPSVTLYRNGVLIWGAEPSGSSTPAPTFVPQTSTPLLSTPTTASTAFIVQYMAGDTNLTDLRLKPFFKIFNLSATSIPLAELKLRYWFIRDTPQAEVFSCTYALRGCSNITGTVVLLSGPRIGADAYLEIGFTSGAGNLAANANTGPIQTFIHKSDWSNFNESNDYSFNVSALTYIDWSRVTLYYNGVLVWGTEPQ